MRTIEVRVPDVDLRVLAWLWSSAMLRWHEWHMARMDHTAPAAEWSRRIHSAHWWRRHASAFPGSAR